MWRRARLAVVLALASVVIVAGCSGRPAGSFDPTGACTTDGTFNWLEITNTSTEGDVLPEDLGGRLTPRWGLHLIDVNLALGDLIELVRIQSGQK